MNMTAGIDNKIVIKLREFVVNRYIEIALFFPTLSFSLVVDRPRWVPTPTRGGGLSLFPYAPGSGSNALSART